MYLRLQEPHQRVLVLYERYKLQLRISEYLLCSFEICICTVQNKVTTVYTKNLFYSHLPTKYTAIKNNGEAENIVESDRRQLLMSQLIVTSIGCLHKPVYLVVRDKVARALLN